MRFYRDRYHSDITVAENGDVAHGYACCYLSVVESNSESENDAGIA